MSRPSKPGDRLLAFLGSASSRVLLVAPFMKVATTIKILDAIPAEVSDIMLVTRWTAEEVAQGVSDLEVHDLVLARAGARLMLYPPLHGKLYRVDDNGMLVGSANMSNRACGWHKNPNLELLLPYGPDELTDAFLEELLAGAQAATAELRAAVAAAANRLKKRMPKPEPAWLPRYSSPYHLWNVYKGIEAPGMVSSLRVDAEADLASLGIGLNLDEASFVRTVQDSFLAQPFVQLVVQSLDTGLSDAAAVLLIQAEIPYDEVPHGSAASAWEILKRWLTTFGGGQFRVQSTGEELVRRPLI